MDILIRMLMAVLKDRKHKKQRRVLSTVLAAVVVFMTTYSLILPAITLEESTAETTDGIFLESADVSEADPADDDVDPSGELLLTDDAREESAQASDGWEDGLIEDADWEENGELADIPDEPALTDTGDEATPDGILEEATDAAEAEEDTQALSFTDGELTVRETLVSRQGGEDFLRLTYGAEARIPEDTVCSAQAFIPASSGAAMDEGSSLAEKYEQAAREKAARDYPEWDKIEVRMFDLQLAANGQTVQAEDALHSELTLAQPIRSEALLLLHFEDNEAQEELRRIYAGETAGASSVEVHLPEVMHDAEFIRNANGEVYKIRFASQTLNTFAVVIRGESEETENRKEETAHETEPLTEAGTEAATETLTESTAAGDETEEAAETETGNVYAETEEATEAVTETASEATEEATEDTTESEESVGEGETESELEEQYPEVEFSDSTQYTQVQVYAPEGAFPEGTQMLLSDVEDDETIAAICDAALTENSLVQKVHAVDISFRNSRNEEVEPLLPIRVEMTAEKCAEVGSSSVSSSVVHVDDSGNATIVENAQKVEAEAEDEKDADKLEDVETIAFEAKEFSVYALVYTVDFEYSVNGKMYQFSLPGGGFVSFTDLVEVLGIIGDTNFEKNGDENGSVIAENAEENVVNEGAEEIDVNSDTNTSLTLGDVEVSEATRKFVEDVASVEFSTPSLVDVSKVESETTVGQIKDNRGLECEYSAELTKEQIVEINAQTVEAGDWALISVQPFTSEEQLTVTMKDGEVFKIRVTDAQIKKTVIDAKGDTWEITVTYGEDAQIPNGAELKVREILPEDEEYEQYYQQSLEKVGVVNTKAVAEASEELDLVEETVEATEEVNDPIKTSDLEKEEQTATQTSDYTRIFDIEIWADDHKVEPAADVTVNIKLLDAPEETGVTPQVVHFAKDGAELMALKERAENSKDEGIQFVTDEFSVYSVVYTVDFFYNGYGFSIKGGDAISLKELAEKLHLVEVAQEVTEETDKSEDNEYVTPDEIQEPKYRDAEEFIANVKNVEFSNPELIWVGEIESNCIAWDLMERFDLEPFYPYGMTEQEYISCVTKQFTPLDWALLALNPFDSEERLTISMKDGSEIIINVTDEQNAQMTTDEHGNAIVDTITNPAGTTFDVFDYWILDSSAQGRSAWPGHAGNGNNFSYDYNGYDYRNYSADPNFTYVGSQKNDLWIPSYPGSSTYVINPNRLRGNGNNQGINAGHAFKFSPSTGHTVLDGTLGTPTVDGTQKINSYTGDADPTVGLVEGTLTGGYPKLTTDTTLGTNGESLSYLFDSSSHAGKARYSGADHLLYVDEDGYYTFDSRDYWASFDTGSKNFTLTEQTSDDTTVRGFWPFGDRNYWVGMHMNTQFSMPRGGQVLNPKGVYKDMEFEFSGDDDTWLYIDGVLVGDGGGIHNRTDIKINFRTGLVTVTGTEDTYGHAGTYTWTKYLDEIFRDAGKYNANDFDGHTFKEGTYHTFDMFYLERGGGESNLYIHYNLVSTADFTGHKEYHGETGTERLQRNQFKFDLIGLDGQYDTSGNLIRGKENVRAIMPVNPNNIPANVTTNPAETDAGTVAKPLYLENTTTALLEDGEYVNHTSQTYRTGVTEDGNINFGTAVIPEEYIRNYDPSNPTIFHYVVREYVPDTAVNANGKTWAASSEAERREGGYVLDNITYDGTIYYMSAAVTRWQATDSDGNPKVDSSGNPVYQYGLSKRYFTDDTYTTQPDENHRFINFDNRYMEPLTLKINKKGENNNKLPGADFKLSRAVYDENTAKWNVISGVDPMTGTTDGNGQLKFENLAAGNYILEETRAPEGYKDAKNKWLVTLTRTDTVTGEGENAVKKSHLEATITLLNKDGSVPAGATAQSKTVVNHEFEHEILNEVKPPAEITVEKKWLDENGDELEDHPGQITFKVYQLQHQHVWGEWTVTKEATEDEEGSRERTCTVDGAKQTEIIPKKDHVHVLVKVDAVAATCISAGNIEYWECSKDHLKFSDSEGTTQVHDVAIAALGHDYQVTAETPATCTTDGSRTLVCSRCDDTYTETIDALGHSWGDWVTVTEATTNAEGLKKRTCSVCGTEDTEVIPKKTNVYPGTDIELQDYTWPSSGGNVNQSGIFKYGNDYWVIVKNQGYVYSGNAASGPSGLEGWGVTVKLNGNVSDAATIYGSSTWMDAGVAKGTIVKGSDGAYYVRTKSDSWSGPPSSSSTPDGDGWYKLPISSGIQSAPQQRMSLAKRSSGLKGTSLTQNVPVSELDEQSLLESLGLTALNTLNDETGNKLIVYGSTTTLATPVGNDHIWSVNIPIEAEDENGIAYKYYVIEDDPGSDYTTTYSGQENGLVDKGEVTITNQIKPQTGSLRITKAVKVNGSDPNSVDQVLKNKADGTYTFEIYDSTGTTKVTQKADGTAIGELSITVTDGVATSDITVDGLTPATYVLKETDSSNAKTSVDTSVTGYDSEKGGIVVTVSAGDSSGVQTAAFTNKYSETSITVKKTDSTKSGSDRFIAGAKFSLYKVETTDLLITDPIVTKAGTETAVSVIEGRFEIPVEGITISGLQDGSYKLVEREAPAGYIITNNTTTFTVSAGRVTEWSLSGTEGTTLEIPNTPGAALPNTGGPGTRLFTILGSILILGAGVLLWRRRRLI